MYFFFFLTFGESTCPFNKSKSKKCAGTRQITQVSERKLWRCAVRLRPACWSPLDAAFRVLCGVRSRSMAFRMALSSSLLCSRTAGITDMAEIPGDLRESQN